MITPGFKQITTEEEFQRWAKAANECSNIEVKCKLQDIYGHSETNVVKNLFLQNNNNWRLFLFSVWKVMGDEYFWNLVKAAANKLAQETIDTEMKVVLDRYADLHKQEKVFVECKKPIHKKIYDLNKEVKRLLFRNTVLAEALKVNQEKITSLHQDYQELNMACHKMKEELEAYKNIKSWIRTVIE